MNERVDIMKLLENKPALLEYVIRAILSSDKFARNLPQMKERGWSQEGMLDKVIEITAIQAQQIKHLALIAMLLVQSDKFDFMIAQMLTKMGRGEDVLRAMMEQKLKNKY